MSAFLKMKALLKGCRERIAIVIPVYDVTLFLEEAIISAISQDYPHKEVIVVDDGSAPEPAAEIERICNLFAGIVLLRQEHAGPAAARDRGVAYTSADFIVFLDGDDVLLPGALTYLAKSLSRNPDAVAAYAKLKYIDKRGNVIGSRATPTSSGRELLYNFLERRPCFCNGSVCVRRKALERLSPDNHSMVYAEDWVLWCHLALSGNIIFAGNRIVLHYRHHTQNSTSAYRNYASIIAPYNAIFNDSAFINAIGKDKLDLLRRKCLCRIHVFLALFCSRNGKLEEAAYYLEQVDMSYGALAA